MSESIAKLIFEYNGNIIKKLLIVKDNSANITIGKNNSCTVVYTDPEVSRMHAQINFDGHQLSIKDLSSTNGTYINKTKIQSGQTYTMSVGDHITFSNTGNSRLTVSSVAKNIDAIKPKTANSINYKPRSNNINSYLMWGSGIIVGLVIFYFSTREIDPLDIKLKDINEPCEYVNTELKILEDYYEILEKNEGEDVKDWNQNDKKRAKKLKKRSNQINDRANNKLDADEREEMEDCDDYKTRKRLKEDINDLEEDINNIHILNGNTVNENTNSLDDE